jgi:cell division septation protein DedD
MPLSRRVIAGAILAAHFLVSPALADVKAGVDAWQRGNYTAAIAEWRPLADAGVPDAQFNLGQAYKLGRGVPADLKSSQSWYEKAALQGHEEAQTNLGLIMFQSGQQEAAMVWIRKAADRGDPRAEFILATALFNGDNVAKDLPRAYALMSHAAAQGLVAASTSLAEMENVIPESDRQEGMKLVREMLRKDVQQTAMTQAPTPAANAKTQPAAPPKQAGSKTAASSVLLAQNVPPVRAAPAPAKAAPPSSPKNPVEMASATPSARTASPATTAQGASSMTTRQGRWRVQFGAYGSIDLAKGQWGTLSKKLGVLAGLSPSYEPFGALTRLRVNSLADRSAAEKLCAAAKAAGQACFLIAP